jgi:hypothetical protein
MRLINLVASFGLLASFAFAAPLAPENSGSINIFPRQTAADPNPQNQQPPQPLLETLMAQLAQLQAMNKYIQPCQLHS